MKMQTEMLLKIYKCVVALAMQMSSYRNYEDYHNENAKIQRSY